MKILIISTYDLNGGAGKASYRLFESLKSIPEYDVKMLVLEKRSNESRVINVNSFIIKYFIKIIQSLDNLFLLFYPKRNGMIFSTSWISFSPIKNYIKKFQPNIISIHWINNGFLSLNQIKSLQNITKAPLIFTMHDMWIFTGGCHYTLECQKFIQKCNNCQILKSKSKYDLSTFNFNRKRLFFNKISNNCYFVGVSNWITEEAKKSKILLNNNIVNLPNTIDTNFYFPISKIEARKALGIDSKKTLLLFGAMNANSNKLKGFDILKLSLNNLDYNKYLLVIYGNNNDDFSIDINLETKCFGIIQDEISMRLLYSSADLFLLPSIQENLSNSVLESMSCETPVVAYNIGGNSDMIIHNYNGYLAKPFNYDDFTFGINYLVDNDLTQLSINSRISVINKFSYPIVATQYKNFFEKII